MTRRLLPAVATLAALTSAAVLSASPVRAAGTPQLTPAPTSLVLGTNGIAGYKAEKPDISHGPQYDDGCKAVGGRVLTLEKGGTEVTGSLSKTTGGVGIGTGPFTDVEESVDVHTDAAAALAGIRQVRREAAACGVSIDDSDKPTGKVSISRAPAVAGLSPVARFSITGAKFESHKFNLALDVYRRGRYVLAVTAFRVTVKDGAAVFGSSSRLLSLAEKAAGATLVRATPEP